MQAGSQGGAAKEGRSGGRVARGIAFSALGGVCWGFSGTCAQLLTSGMGVPVSWITCVRLTGAAIIFLIVCLVREPRNLLAAARDGSSMLAIAGFALLGVLLTQASYLTAIAYTNAGTGTVLERLGLVLIMLYVCLRMRRLPKPREFAGLVLAIAGTVLIATKGNFGTLAIPFEGLFWGLVSAFALACYTLMPARALEKWGAFIVTGLAMLIGGVSSTVFVRPWALGVEVDGAVLGLMTLMVVVGTFCAYLFYLQGITDAGPVRAGLVGCVEPVAATVIAAVWLGTPVTVVDALGCGMIVVMVFLVTDRGDEAAGGARAYDGAADPQPVFRGRADRLGYYGDRVATRDDLPRLKELLEQGRAAQRALGIKEAGKRYPSSRRLLRAVNAGTVRVVELAPAADRLERAGSAQDPASRVIGMFGVDLQGDPAYTWSDGAEWRTVSPDYRSGKATYASLYWVVVDARARRCGVGAYIAGTAERMAREAGKRSVRTDVFDGNEPVRALLEGRGYASCGHVELRDRLGRTKRRAAFERVL